MSEYQYYEFLAMDRPLDDSEMAELRGISTRADITPTHFSNEYNYGDLKADPAKLLERYFDVHVYVANWGTHRLAMRLPCDVAAPDDLATYCVGEGCSVRRAGKHTIIDLWSETEDHDGWVDGHGWMGSLAGVRAELMRGDQRPLYLAWLLGLDSGELDDDDEEPPVPSGLGKLPASLASMVEFLRIDEHLVAAAAEASTAERPEPGGMARWIARLPQKEKDGLLLRVAQGEHAHVAAALVRRFRKEMLQEGSGPAPQRRTVAELLARADELRQAELRRQARAAAEARRKREAAAAAAKAKRLDALAARKLAAWRDVRQLVDSKKPKSYDEAVKILGDLRDLAERENDEMDFRGRLHDLRDEHARKPSFLARLDKAKLR